ncbi:LuxR family transcriptional regulator [Salmonella enterica subsp. enterica serovar Virchow]|nr:LuxR family transcriptional regulator [Salmonella enterica subsp. enterica serovar Virchow]
MIKIHVLTSNYYLRSGMAQLAVMRGYRINILHPEYDCDLSGLDRSDRVIFHPGRTTMSWLPQILLLSGRIRLMLISTRNLRLDAICEISETVDEDAPLSSFLSALDRLAETGTQARSLNSSVLLTKRERYILCESLAGASADAIAGQLNIDTKTVLAHRQNACKKLGTGTLQDIIPLKNFILEWDRSIHQNSL